MEGELGTYCFQLVCCQHTVFMSMLVQVHFPPALTVKQRAILHTAASQHGLQHQSSGDGNARYIWIGSDNGRRLEVSCRPNWTTPTALCGFRGLESQM